MIKLKKKKGFIYSIMVLPLAVLDYMNQSKDYKQIISINRIQLIKRKGNFTRL